MGIAVAEVGRPSLEWPVLEWSEVVVITVDRLVHGCGIEMTFLAGEGGRSRPLTWAHVIDTADTWNWIDAGELILTTGVGIPHEESQVEWMEKVTGSGANGLVLASGPGTVGLGRAALDCADAASFPVLSASFTAKFTELAKEVINVSLQQDTQRLAAAQRVFSVYSTALTGAESLERRLTGVARRVGLSFVICDPAGQVVFTNDPKGLTRSVQGGEETVALDSWVEPLRLTLRVRGSNGELIGPSLRHSFALVTGIELHRRITRESEHSALVEAQLETLIRHGIDEDLAMDAVVRSTLAPDGKAVIVAVDEAAAGSFDRIRLDPHLWNTSTLTLVHRGTPLLVVDGSAESLGEVEKALGEHGGGRERPLGR